MFQFNYARLGNFILTSVAVCMCLITLSSPNKVDFGKGDTELTIHVGPTKHECFFQFAVSGQLLNVQYQVTDATFEELHIKRELKVDFHLQSPEGRELITDYKKVHGSHSYQVKTTGVYKICFDNSFSKLSSKTVYFEVYFDTGDDSDELEYDDVEFSPEPQNNSSIRQIKVFVGKIKENLIKLKHYQDINRALEARDRNILERNFTRVNTISCLTTITMMLVSGLHLLMVKSLFEEKSLLHRIYRTLS